MLKHLGKIKIPSRITGKSLAYNMHSDPIDTLTVNDVNTREGWGAGILWCYSVEDHYDDDNYLTSILLIVDSNQHTLNVLMPNNKIKSLTLSRGDAIVFRSDYLHSLTRPNNRKALFCALFLDNDDKQRKYNLDDAKKMLEDFV